MVGIFAGSAVHEYRICGIYSDITNGGKTAKAVDIRKYVTNTYGQTIREVRMAAVVAMIVAALVMFVVVVLFTRLLVAKDRSDISLRKAIGFSSAEVRSIYMGRFVPLLAVITVFLALSIGLCEIKNVRAYECL